METKVFSYSERSKEKGRTLKKSLGQIVKEALEIGIKVGVTVIGDKSGAIKGTTKTLKKARTTPA